eukprot:10400723-Lingulodinium_polyedra.AAC.1
MPVSRHPGYCTSSSGSAATTKEAAQLATSPAIAAGGTLRRSRHSYTWPAGRRHGALALGRARPPPTGALPR